MAGITTRTKGISLPSLTTATVQAVMIDSSPFFPIIGRLAMTRGSTAAFSSGLVAWVMRAGGDVASQVAWDAYPLAGIVVRRPLWWPLLLGQEAVRTLLVRPGPYSLHLAFDPLGDANTGGYAFAADVSVMR